MIYTTEPDAKKRPVVLLVLAGAHHLELYRSILAQCQAFDWVVYIKDIHSVSDAQIRWANIRFGTKFFTDKATTLAHFGTIDAVVTTFAVPHCAHLHYLDFIALAYEMGIPVFELQHGLFQIGMTAQENAALVGSGHRAARNALPGPNLVTDTLRWFGEDAIGYPPHTEINHPNFGYLHDGLEQYCAPDRILFMTNFHWNLISDDEVTKGYNLIVKSILSLPDCTFVISPHPAEMANKNFLQMQRRLENRNAVNYSILRPANAAERFQMLQQIKLAISTISTVLLDLEMWRIPTFLFDLDCYSGLWDGFEDYVAISDGDDMVYRIKEAIYRDDLPNFTSGKLQRFDPAELTRKITDKLCVKPMAQSAYVPLIQKYIQQVS